MTQIRTWLDFALQQFAAESYLHRFLSGELQLDQVLQLGNNNQPGALPNAALLPGKTRMANQQISNSHSPLLNFAQLSRNAACRFH